MAYSPDGRLLITGGDDGVTIWNAATAQQLHQLPQTGHVFALSPDGRLLVSSSQTGFSAKLFDRSSLSTGATESPSLVDVLAGHTGSIQDIAFGPDGQIVATASADGTVRTWGLGSVKASQVYRGHQGRVGAVVFHSDGRVLASGDQQPGVVKMWDVTRPAEHNVAINFGPDLMDVEALTFTADDRELAAFGLGGLLKRWDPLSGQVSPDSRLPTNVDWHVPSVRHVFLDAGQKLATVSGEDPTLIKVWNVRDASPVATLAGHTMKVWHVAGDRAGHRVASAANGTADGKAVREVKVWETATGRTLWSATRDNERTLALALNPDGAWLAESHQGISEGKVFGEAWLSPLRDQQRAIPLAVPTGSVRVFTFSRDGSLLAGATDEGAVILWETRTGQAIHPRPIEGEPGLSDLAFNPDGSRLAGVSREAVRVWDVLRGQTMVLLRGAPLRSSYNGFNPRITWSHDGSRLAASNWDRTVSVWDNADVGSFESKEMLRRQAASRSFAWHLDQLGQHPMTAWAQTFHLRRLQDLEPPTAGLRRQRGNYYARLQKWDRALADFPAPDAGEPSGDLDGLPQRALLLLHTGDPEGYHRLLTEVLPPAGKSSNPDSLRLLSRAAVLAPLPDAQTRLALEVVQRCRAAVPPKKDSLDYLGLGRLRAGQLREAGESLREALKLHNNQETAARSTAGLALVHLRAGEPELAKPYLQRSEAWLQEQARRLPREGVAAVASWDWQLWLEVQILHREARTAK